MNEFELYQQLKEIESIAGQYTSGKAFIPEIKKAADSISSREYRVAVIGEFKRGKSSLVNAIIGSEVLPTDILPMTAAITRVTYGTERKILIRYRDGHTEENTVAQLMEYATKYDEQKAKRAAAVEEIEVSYPSPFLKNHIDIIDTPGLNDTDKMTEVTLGVLGEVDAALVVISANYPISMTEKNLIIDLISRRQIRHLVFAITHIDAVSSRKSQQDKQLQYLTERISNDVLEMALERFEGDAFFTEKAKSILQKPDLFGVSSVLAIDGFVRDDPDMLEESRFPYFKNELLALLTAAQSVDVVAKVKDIADIMRQKLPQWQTEDAETAAATKRELEAKISALTEYYADFEQLITKRHDKFTFELIEQKLNSEKMCSKLKQYLPKHFINELRMIREENNNDQSIRAALHTGQQNAQAHVDTLYHEMADTLTQLINEHTNDYGEFRRKTGFSGKDFVPLLQQWLVEPMPVFSWTESPIDKAKNLVGVDVMKTVDKSINASVKLFKAKMLNYVSSWKKMIAKQMRTDAENTSLLEICKQQLEELNQRIVYQNVNNPNNVNKIEKISEMLK